MTHIYSHTTIEDYKRSLQMIELRKQGETLQSIGDKFGICRERVRQILKKAGIKNIKEIPNQNYEGLLSLNQIIKMTGFTKERIYSLTSDKKFPEPITKRFLPKNGSLENLYDPEEVNSACKFLFDKFILQLKEKLESKKFGNFRYTYAYHKKLIEKQLDFLQSKPFSSNHWHGQLSYQKSPQWKAHDLLTDSFLKKFK